MIECSSLEYAMDKITAKKAKQKDKEENASSKFYDICRKYDTDIYGLKKDKMTKAEYKQVTNYLSIIRLPLELYPNLQ